MNRRGFIYLATALPLLGADRGEAAVPVELRGGRFFAVPRTLDGRTFACWLDTDGSGFIFDWAVDRFGLKVRTRIAAPHFRRSIRSVRSRRYRAAFFRYSKRAVRIWRIRF